MDFVFLAKLLFYSSPGLYKKLKHVNTANKKMLHSNVDSVTLSVLISCVHCNQTLLRVTATGMPNEYIMINVVMMNTKLISCG